MEFRAEPAEIARAASDFFGSWEEPPRATTRRTVSSDSMAATPRHDNTPLLRDASRGDEKGAMVLHADVSDSMTVQTRDVALAQSTSEEVKFTGVPRS